MLFRSAKTYDIEVWMPSKNSYKEISSCSNFESFQSKRLNSRYKIHGRKVYTHTLNASALPIGRTLMAIIENYQDNLGNISIPDVLKRYMI